MSFLWISLLLSLFSFLSAASILPAHAHKNRAALPDTWYHTRDHLVHALFRNDISTDGHYYPTVGSSGLFLIRHSPRVPADLLHLEAWRKSYPNMPTGTLVDPDEMPQSWKDFLETATKDKKIPNIPQTTLVDGIPTYPASIDPNSPDVCLADLKECRIDGDIWDALVGEVGVGLDDGPSFVSG